MSIQTENNTTSKVDLARLKVDIANLKIDLASIGAISFFVLYIAAGIYGAIN